MSAGATDGWTLLALAGLTVLTVITRCLFFISARPLPMPRWLERGLQYAPIAALAAVVAPDVLALQMQDFFQWRDARLWAALAAALFYRQFQGRPWTLPGVIGAGMAVYLLLRLGLGLGVMVTEPDCPADDECHLLRANHGLPVTRAAQKCPL